MSLDDPALRGGGHPDHALIDGLEPDQTVAAAARPFGRYHASRSVTALLWAVRVFVLLIAAMLVYTFIVSIPH
ncbi:MAG: hypothetical protein EOP67_55525 [Sphingomonas sp.]|nr:MAG: hypothetical protein EOP67_55525 [Sphingomonas sp.]